MNRPYDPLNHHRRSIRLKDYDYSSAGAYFITIVVQGRICCLGGITNNELQLSEYGEIVNETWVGLPARFPNIELDAFIVMPNHLHGILFITNAGVGAIHELPLPPNQSSPQDKQRDSIERRKMLLPKLIGYFKMNTAKRINLSRKTESAPFWQRNYYEHVIRNDADLARIRDYVQNNPHHWNEDQLYPNSA